jgi:hypothetical protein
MVLIVNDKLPFSIDIIIGFIRPGGILIIIFGRIRIRGSARDMLATRNDHTSRAKGSGWSLRGTG